MVLFFFFFNKRKYIKAGDRNNLHSRGGAKQTSKIEAKFTKSKARTYEAVENFLLRHHWFQALQSRRLAHPWASSRLIFLDWWVAQVLKGLANLLHMPALAEPAEAVEVDSLESAWICPVHLCSVRLPLLVVSEPWLDVDSMSSYSSWYFLKHFWQKMALTVQAQSSAGMHSGGFLISPVCQVPRVYKQCQQLRVSC